MTRYAEVYWTVDDVLSAANTAKISMTNEQAEEFLDCLEDVIRDNMVARGWETIFENIRDYGDDYA